jgi:hypothetical protein
MAKYPFHRLTPHTFEDLVKTLLERIYRPTGGTLIQFGPGPDGGREATWIQPHDHPNYTKPLRLPFGTAKHWVFQAKMYDADQRGWTLARRALLHDIEKELTKIRTNRITCHVFVLATNLPMTGVLGSGTRDRIDEIVKRYRRQGIEVQVWDAADLSRQLDAYPDVRTTFVDVLPGDVIAALLRHVKASDSRTRTALKAYLAFLYKRDSTALTGEAGDDSGLPLADVYIDLLLRNASRQGADPTELLSATTDRDDMSRIPSQPVVDNEKQDWPASSLLLLQDFHHVLLVGLQGSGKSTITQFLAAYHAARLVKPDCALQLARRLQLPRGLTPEDVDATCTPRFPFRVELRRYAAWLGKRARTEGLRGPSLAEYLAETLVNPHVDGTLTAEDIYALAGTDPLLLILDGLDEVPHPAVRREIIEHLEIFLRRVRAAGGNLQIVLSCRPGYAAELDRFDPWIWVIQDLSRDQFNAYCEAWLAKRIVDVSDRQEALDRVARGMRSEQVVPLATTLLQATVMLTLVKRRMDIPHERYRLYAKYVEVIFQREAVKSPTVHRFQDALMRLLERVAYELHRGMQHSPVRPLDWEGLRSHVHRVLEDYLVRNLGPDRLGQTVDDIIYAAIHRLGFLTDAGDGHRGIDFVRQSFRESFAAGFLCNDATAHPDKVFEALVNHGPYWSGVLQFYVARHNPNQQSQWITWTEDDIQPDDVEGLLRTIKLKRALLAVLPEFGVQRKSEFSRTLRSILAPATRWAIITQPAVSELLPELRSGNGHDVLRNLLESLSTHDVVTMRHELRLLLSLGQADASWSRRLQEVLESAIQEPSLLPIALKGLLDRQATISVPDLSVELWHDVPTRELPPSEHWLPKASCDNLARVVYVMPWLAGPSQAAPGAPGVDGLLNWTEFSVSGGEYSIGLRPYAGRRLPPAPVMAPGAAEHRECGVHQHYLESLVQSAAVPDDHARFAYAVAQEHSLPHPRQPLWSPTHVLGPSPEQFASIEQWQEFQRRIRRPEALEHLKGIDDAWAWLAVLFHADDWSICAGTGLLTPAVARTLRDGPLGGALCLPSFPIDLLRVAFARNAKSVAAFPVRQLLDSAMAAWRHGRLAPSNGIRSLVNQYAVHTRPGSGIDRVLLDSLELMPLPVGWPELMLVLAAQEPKIDVDLLVRFWARHGGAVLREGARFPAREDQIKQVSLTVNRILEKETDEAFWLAVNIARPFQLADETQAGLRRQLCERLSQASRPEQETDALVMALLSLSVNAEELHFWHKSRVANAWLARLPYRASLIGRRISLATPTTEERAAFRIELLQMLSRRQEWPTAVRLGALEAILGIDAVARGPIENHEFGAGPAANAASA